MVVDLALILVLATVLTGFIWLLDSLVFKPRRVTAADGSVPEPVIVEYARSFFPVILIVLVVRSFLYEPFRIPSGSMMPTLLVGDFLFVNKFTYGLRLPVLNKKFVELNLPERGDVVVFRLPSDPSTNYIKRVGGLPGDEVSYRNKQLFVNGNAMPTEQLGPYTGHGDPCGRGSRNAASCRTLLFLENLDGQEHEILQVNSPHVSSKEGEWRVPDGHYFLMGDNRDNSRDSRYPEVSVVPEANLVGKAVRIWMNWDWSGSTPIWSRIGNAIN